VRDQPVQAVRVPAVHRDLQQFGLSGLHQPLQGAEPAQLGDRDVGQVARVGTAVQIHPQRGRVEQAEHRPIGEVGADDVEQPEHGAADVQRTGHCRADFGYQ
jgi:hypothetical protein